MNIVYYKDLVDFLIKAKQNILVISSNILFGKNKLEIKMVDDKISLIDSDNTLHENLLTLMLKSSWNPDEVKVIVGYCVVMDLISKIESSDINKNKAYSPIMDISNGAWRSAFTSNQEIDRYKQKVELYNKISPEERIMIDIGQISGMSAPENPLNTNKKLAIYNMEKLFINKNPLSLSRKIQCGDVVSLNGEKVILTHFDFNYHFNQALLEHVAVDKMYDEHCFIDGFDYRVQHVPTQDGGSISTFRFYGTVPVQSLNDK